MMTSQAFKGTWATRFDNSEKGDNQAFSGLLDRV